ncbi:MAG: hypothetical protein K2J04_00325 [Lachnospiraceae bacterium]|nr:hypothetical protein [Lachnospiraceae bacterium]
MTCKKTWISYVLWALYTCAAGVILADYAILFWQKYVIALIDYGTIIFVFLVFAVVAGCYFLIRKALSKYHRQDSAKRDGRINSKTACFTEVFIALGAFFAGLLYRICLYLQSTSDMIVMTQYYHAATLKAGAGVEPIVHGASYLYTLCLSFVLSFLGNKADAAVYLQIFLQMLTILLAFFAVRKIAGSIPACTAMLMLAFSSVYAGQIFILTPESFFFLLYLAGLFIIGSYMKMYCRGNFSAAAGIAGAFLSGITIGILCYLDAISLTLLLLLPAVFTGIQKREKNEFFSAKISASFLILILASGGLIFMSALTIDAFYSHREIGRTAETWFLLYGNHIKADYIFYQTNQSIIECSILVVSAALLIMAFWNRRREQNASFWILLMFLLSPTPLTAVGVLPYQIFSIFIWSVLAGIGLQQSFVWEDGKVAKTAVNKQTMDEDKNTVEMNEPAPEAEAEASAPVSAPRFIENPLPLPKKHEKREMGYQYEIEEDKMNFDVEIKENDDFDFS